MDGPCTCELLIFLLATNALFGFIYTLQHHVVSCPILQMVISDGLDWQLVPLPSIPVTMGTKWLDSRSGCVWAMECGVDRNLLAYVWRIVYTFCTSNIKMTVREFWSVKNYLLALLLLEQATWLYPCTLCLILAICDSVCESGGICTAPDTCVCLAGYSGDRCENGMF